jgi:hypothetical protein
LLLAIAGALSGYPEDRAHKAGDGGPAGAPRSSSPTPDAAENARLEAAALMHDSDYPAAMKVLEDAGLQAAADRVRRLGARRLLVAASEALGRARGSHEAPKPAALDPP